MDNFKFDKKTIYITILIFLASRASFFGILPFGYPACCVMLISDTYNLYPYNIALYAAACILGTLSKSGMSAVSIIILMCLALTICLFYIAGKKIDIHSIKTLYIALVPVIVYTVVSIFVLWINNPTIGDVLKILVQGIFLFVVFFVYRIAEHHINYTKSLGPEDLSMLAIIIIVAVMGIPDVVFFGLSLRNILSLLLIMIFSGRGGSGAGAGAGIVIGVLTQYNNPVTICLYAFCGFLSGLFKGYGKFSVVIAFCAGNTVLAFFMGGLPQIISGMYETGMAVVIFLLLPKQITDLVKIPVVEMIPDNNIELIYERRMCMNAIKKISGFSNLFKNLSENMPFFTCEKSASKGKEEYVRIHNKICKDCDMKKMCWEHDKAITGKYIEDMTMAIENGTYPKEEAMRRHADTCMNISRVWDEIENAYEIKRLNKISDEKLNEYRGFISHQLYEIGCMSDALIDDIKHGMSFNREQERMLISALRQEDIRVLDVIIVNECRQEDYVTIYIKGFYRQELIEKAVSIVMKEEYVVKKVIKKSKGMSEIHCIVKPVISAQVITKQWAADGKTCGDSYSFIEDTPWGQCIAISDGMGTGEKACRQSSTALKVVEMYIRSGVNVKNSMDIINMMLDSGNDEVKTATLDICMINCYEKKAVFSKSGAMNSLVLRKNGETESVKSQTLPAGSGMAESEIHTSEVAVESGDLIVMYTDGFSDAFARGGMQERVFTEFVSAVCRKYINKNQYESICSQLLSGAVKYYGEYEKDDITVAVIRIV